MGALTTADAAGLSTALLAWWELHGRGGIPWKLLPGGVSPAPGQDLDPYGIWIAEVMLQQTQLAVVLPYWREWMAVPFLYQMKVDQGLKKILEKDTNKQ